MDYYPNIIYGTDQINFNNKLDLSDILYDINSSNVEKNIENRLMGKINKAHQQSQQHQSPHQQSQQHQSPHQQSQQQNISIKKKIDKLFNYNNDNFINFILILLIVCVINNIIQNNNINILNNMIKELIKLK